MDFGRLSPAEQIAGGAGVVLILVMFIFDWFGVEVEGGIGGGSGNAWESFTIIDIILFLAALSGIALAVVKASGESEALPVPLSVVVVVLAGLGTLLVLIRLISPPSFEGIADAPGVDSTRKFGAFLGFIVTAVLTYGGYLAMQEEGSSFGDVGGGRDRDRGRDRDLGREPEPPDDRPRGGFDR
jgi:hypothetical protein